LITKPRLSYWTKVWKPSWWRSIMGWSRCDCCN
jgi:hypothetical protein